MSILIFKKNKLKSFNCSNNNKDKLIYSDQIYFFKIFSFCFKSFNQNHLQNKTKIYGIQLFVSTFALTTIESIIHTNRNLV